eukprot:COSAG05_NODE_22200_length_266_cov_0.910180_1_plen_57_part_10
MSWEPPEGAAAAAEVLALLCSPSPSLTEIHVRTIFRTRTTTRTVTSRGQSRSNRSAA